MPDVLHRTTLNIIRSVNNGTIEADYPSRDWVHDPDLKPVEGEPKKYWVLTGDILSVTDDKAAADAAEEAAKVDYNRTQALYSVDTTEISVGWRDRAMVGTTNQRDNYILNRLIEMQDTFAAIKASEGPADAIRDAIPSAFLPTSPRDRPEAVDHYKDEINSGRADT